MDRTLLTFLIMLLIAGVNAKIIQPGFVKEYNEKSEKTPLPFVELRISKAGTTLSDQNGQFNLEFLTQKPGEHVNVSRIEKLGYEIFNKEAIEQWNINPDLPFIVVMCRSDRFKAIRDNYEKVASENYAFQLDKEKAALKKLKEAGKLREAEYNQKLTELQDNYYRQLDNLDNYIDRFSRIDLNEISAAEQEIIELVQQGSIDEAIAKYDNLKIIDQLVTGLRERQKVKSAISRLAQLDESYGGTNDSLYAMAERQIEALKLAGGSENNKKLLEIYHTVAEADTTNPKWMLATGKYIRDYVADYNGALNYFRLALDGGTQQYGTVHPLVAEAYNEIGNVCRFLGNYEEALDYYSKALAIREEIFGHEHPDVAVSYRNIGLVYNYMGEYDNALDNLTKALDILEGATSDNTMYIHGVYESLGNLYYYTDEYDKALEWHAKALETRVRTYGTYHPHIATSQKNIGSVYFSLGNYRMALQHYKTALRIWEKVYGKSHPDVATLHGNIGDVCYSLGDYEKALEHYTDALALWEKTHDAPDFYVASLSNNIGYVYDALRQYDKALEFLQDALDIIVKMTPEDDSDINRITDMINSITLKQTD